MTSMDGIPPPISFNIEHQEQAEVCCLLAKIGGPPYIGISWWGGFKEDITSFRQVDFCLLAELFQDEEGTIINLQRDSDKAEIRALSGSIGYQVRDFSDYNKDLESNDCFTGLIKPSRHHK